ncbi:WYL domain-containing protein [Thalassospira sp. MA62]|nr:WYL domain-containing protein [Thalassospira sp. MA62]
MKGRVGRPRKQQQELSPAERERFCFIEEMLIWRGSLNRIDLVQTFQISENHASQVIKGYERWCPNNLKYDLRTKTFRPSENFKATYADANAANYLTKLNRFSNSTNVNDKSLPFLVPIARMPEIESALDQTVLRKVIHAIHEGHGLQVEYQSMSRPAPHRRTLWPHSMINGGNRWLARCFDEESYEFRDFALSRILELNLLAENRPDQASPEFDSLWAESVEVNLIANPDLSAQQLKAVEKEYCFAGKHLPCSVSVQKAVVPYFLDRYGLRKRENYNTTHAAVLIENWEKVRIFDRLNLTQSDKGL